MTECRVTRAALLSVLLLAAACTHDEPPEVRPLAIQIEEELVLGADESADLDAQFSFPVSISTDADGRIYVADQGENMLKVFERDGRLAWTAGSEGQGPGEFQRMSDVLVERERVLVRDMRQGIVNWYRRDGSFGGMITAEPTRVRLGRALHALGDGRILTAAISSSTPDSVLKSPALHVVTPDFQLLEASFGALGSMPYEPAEWSFLLASNSGTALLSGGGTRAFLAPWTYAGEIYRYDAHGSAWADSDTLMGFSPHTSPLSVLDQEPEAWQNMAVVYLANQPKPYQIALHHVSEALYELSDGRLVHFSLLEGDGRVQHYVELFDDRGNLLAHGPLPVFPEGMELERFYQRRILHKDADDRFYVVDRTTEPPVVRVVRMEFVVP